jgi:hypothetical protein
MRGFSRNRGVIGQSKMVMRRYRLRTSFAGLRGLALALLAIGLFSCRNAETEPTAGRSRAKAAAPAPRRVSRKQLADLVAKIKASRGALAGMSYRVNAVLQQGMVLDGEGLKLLAEFRKSTDNGVVSYSLYNVRGPYGAASAAVRARENTGEIIEVRAVGKRSSPPRR